MRNLVIPTLLALAACGTKAPPPDTIPDESPVEAASSDMPEAPVETPVPTATPAAPVASPPVNLEFVAKTGSKLKGTANLVEEAGGVKVTLKIEGISPGLHGAHVHEKGDCSDVKEFKNAGGHFNPEMHDHALPDAKADQKRHLGDLGNIEIAKDGKGELVFTSVGATLKANDLKSFLGKAIIIHEKKDDGGQPVGNAGGRIGCGLIPDPNAPAPATPPAAGSAAPAAGSAAPAAGPAKAPTPPVPPTKKP